MVRVGDSKEFIFESMRLMDMKRNDLLKALRKDENFAPSLERKGLRTADMTVLLVASASKFGPSAEEEAAAVELRQAATISDCMLDSAAGKTIFIRVKLSDLPSAEEAGGAYSSWDVRVLL